MELRHLRYFIVVAEELNLSKAAKRLETSQPSLGQQMRDLESEIGVALFWRDKNRFELTTAGSFFVDQARTLLELLESSLRTVRAISRGDVASIVIGSSPSGDAKVLPRLLPALRADYPDLEFSLCSRASRDELIAALLSREVDVAFLRAPVNNPNLATVFLFNEDFMVGLPAAHPLANKPKLSLKELRCLRFISNPAVLLCPAVMSALRSAGIDPFTHNLPWDTRNIMVDLNVIGSGMGFTLLPDYVQQIAPPTVAIRPLDHDPILTIGLLAGYRKDNHSPALGFLLSTLRQLFES